MPKITGKEKDRLAGTISELRADRQPFWSLWRELADYYMPKRYAWLESSKEKRVRKAKNPFILDGTGTKAARILSSGMMNGITSPSRPWLGLSIPGFDDEGGPVTLWLDECTRIMLKSMAQSNFYNSIAVMYLDLVVFGSASMLIYEDFDEIFRCYNQALGEFYLGQNYQLQVDTFAREYCQTVKQLVTRFGEENVSDSVRSDWKRGGGSWLRSVECVHLIEPNLGDSPVPKTFRYRETYWEKGMPQELVLSQRGFNELPGVFPRWELTANDSYGTSPAMDALPDVIQLQQETKLKAQGLDKAIRPPVIADIQLQHRPIALLPNGITYVAGANSIGVKQVYDSFRIPLQEMTTDIRDVQVRIRETFHNELFQMISQLDTVRSATEIDARREEKLVLLGPVLERFENEALDPAVARIFSILQRRGMLPPPPPLPERAEIEITYKSILSVAQRAVAAAPVERWLGVIGGVAGANPDVLMIPNWDELIRNYGLDIGVEARNMNTREAVQEMQLERAQQEQAAQQAEIANQLATGAQTLSETEVGGGSNALQQLLAAQ